METKRLKDPKKECDPADIALKTFFLGPQAENGKWIQELIDRMLTQWFTWRQGVYPNDGKAISESDQETPEFLARRRSFENILTRLACDFEQELPKFSPRYVGHMFSEISLPALMGHLLTLLHNPNNISHESSRVGVRIEDDAIQALIKMVGYDSKTARGHFTSGGTLANFEGLTRARTRMNKWLAAAARSQIDHPDKTTLFEAAHSGWEKYFSSVAYPEDVSDLTDLTTNPFDLAKHFEKTFGVEYRGPVVFVSSSRHYSWDKGVNLLGYGKDSLCKIALDRFGRLSLHDLDKNIERAAREQRPILMLTSMAGTTERGSIDDIHGVHELLESWRHRGIHLWHHVDAAYGGFFKTLSPIGNVLSPSVQRAMDALNTANSVTLDPHKLGYVPYSSGTFLCQSALEYSLNVIEAPYINFHSDSDRGPLTIEGSRSAAGATATWLTSESIGLNSEGYGRILERTIKSAERLEGLLKNSDRRIRVLPHRDSNILCFCIAKEGESVSESNERTQEVYTAFSPDHNSRFMVSKTNLHWDNYGLFLDEFVGQWGARKDVGGLVVIRLCLLNPFLDSNEMNCDMSLEFVNALLKLLDGRSS